MSTVETLRSSLQTFLQTARGPQPKDIYAAQQWEMAGAHAFLINGLLNVYEVWYHIRFLRLSVWFDP